MNKLPGSVLSVMVFAFGSFFSSTAQGEPLGLLGNDLNRAASAKATASFAGYPGNRLLGTIENLTNFGENGFTSYGAEAGVLTGPSLFHGIETSPADQEGMGAKGTTPNAIEWNSRGPESIERSGNLSPLVSSDFFDTERNKKGDEGLGIYLDSMGALGRKPKDFQFEQPNFVLLEDSIPPSYPISMQSDTELFIMNQLARFIPVMTFPIPEAPKSLLLVLGLLLVWPQSIRVRGKC